jgi:PAS domain S-box-containing protein
LRAICNSALDAVITVDGQGRITFWSDAAERMFGHRPEEVLGRDVHETLSPAHYREAAQAGFRAYSQLGHGDRVGQILELEAIRKDGRTFPIEMSLSAFRIDNQWCAAAIVRDITDRKATDNALRRKRENLRQLLELYDRDRQLAAYEIHDGLAQHLAAAQMQFESFLRLEPVDAEAARRTFETGLGLVRTGLREARRLISDLRPPVLDEAGIVMAIEHLLHDQGRPSEVAVEFLASPRFGRLAPPLENALFRIAQEGLTNVLRHSGSPRCRIRLERCDGFVRLEIEDWGKGFDPQHAKRNSFGLEGIRERVRLLGGVAEVISEPGNGTRVRIELPVVEAERGEEGE